MTGGWVKLHRKLRKNPIYSNSNAVHVWIECLLRACHENNIFYLKRQKVLLNEGQFCCGRKEFGNSVNMSPSTAWFWLKQLEVDRYLDIKTSTKGTIVTIKNWGEYQKVDSKVDNKRTADEQRMNINKNVKNVKNILVSKDTSSDIDSTNDFINLFKHVNPSYKKLFSNKTQRASLDRMIKEHGKEKIEKVIRILPKIVGKKYAPTITTPYQLEDKMGQLIAYLQKERSVKNKLQVKKIV